MSDQPEVYPDTKIITLLESNSINNQINGIFDVNLNEQVVLMEGDTLELNKVFIDTTPSEETFINITEEEKLFTIKHGIYLTDMLPNDLTPLDPGPPAVPAFQVKPSWGNWSVAQDNRPDGQKYIMQNEQPAFSNQKLNWEIANNGALIQRPGGAPPFPTPPLPGAPPLAFETELTPLIPADHNGFEYIITALVPADAVAAYPATPGTLLDTKYYMNGHCRLVSTGSDDPLVGPFVFHYYNRDYLPTGGVFGDNDNTAVIERWTNGVSGTGMIIKGWKIRANDATNETVEERKWLFMSDVNGYNYFDVADTQHMVEITEFAMAFDQKWRPTQRADGSIDDSKPTLPGYTIEWFDPRTQLTNRHTKIFDAPQYAPKLKTTTAGKKVIDGGGMITLTGDNPPGSFGILAPYKIQYEDRAGLGLPVGTTERRGKNPTGWEPDNGWDFYGLSSWEDPYDTNSMVTIPKIVVATDNLPKILFHDFRTTAKIGEPTGFVNEYANSIIKYDAATQSMQTSWSQVLKHSAVENAVSTGRSLFPREYTTTFEIAPGNYSNGDFAQILTDKINQNTSPVIGTSNNPAGPGNQADGKPFPPLINMAGYSSSYFFQTTYELLQQTDGYSGEIRNGGVSNLTRYPNDYAYNATLTPARTLDNGYVFEEVPITLSTSTGVQPYFLSEDSSQLFQFVADQVTPLGAVTDVHARNVGASEVSIIFDETEQAFSIAQAHSNIISGGVNATGRTDNLGPAVEPVVQLIRAKPANALSYFGPQTVCDTYSGIFFTALEPQSVWFQKMGLSKNLLTSLGQNTPRIANFSQDPLSSFNGIPDQSIALASVLCGQTRLSKGNNITGIFNGVDLLVTKQGYDPAGNDNTKEAPPSFAIQPTTYGQTSATDTLVGLVGKSLIEASEDDPYYQIEISGINTQNIVGQKTKNSLVQAIVGKFYSNGNFTQSEESGFAYTHSGSPLVIRSLRIRILDSTGAPEAGLGGNSALILKLSTDKK